jgi:hypothetical protein
MKVTCKNVLGYTLVVVVTFGCQGVTKSQQEKATKEWTFDASKQPKRFEIYGAIVLKNKELYGTK